MECPSAGRGLEPTEGVHPEQTKQGNPCVRTTFQQLLDNSRVIAVISLFHDYIFIAISCQRVDSNANGSMPRTPADRVLMVTLNSLVIILC